MKMVNSSEELIEVILAETPELSDALKFKNHMLATCMIREFVSNVFAWGPMEYIDTNIYKYAQAHEIYNLLISKKIIGVCGAISDFLVKIYNLFGYHAIIYNYGIRSTKMTHVTVLVKFPEDGNYYVQDASFRATYVEITEKGEVPCEFFRLLQLIKNEEYEKVAIKRSVNQTIIFRKKHNNHFEDDRYIDIYIENGLNVFINDLVSQNIVADCLKKDVHNTNLYDLMLFPINEYVFKLGLSFDKQLFLYSEIFKYPHQLNTCKNVKVAFFGISTLFFQIFTSIHNTFETIALFDSDETKWHKKFFDIPILPPYELSTINPEKIIISCISVESVYHIIKKYNPLIPIYFYNNINFIEIVNNSDNQQERDSKTDIIIFGAGSEGFRQCQLLRFNGTYNILAFADNDENKWGMEILGYKIIPPNDIKNYPNIKVFIASMYYDEILEQIKNEKLTTSEIFGTMGTKEKL